ncbi:MAG: hypothetical protein V4702_04345 [Patescibacteria group bacterium]
MTNPDSLIPYGVYGELTDPTVLENLTGLNVGEHPLTEIVMSDVQLCFQTMRTIPYRTATGQSLGGSPRHILEAGGADWDFAAPTIRRHRGEAVTGLLVFISPEVHRLIRDGWRLAPLGWYQEIEVEAVRKDGSKLTVVTEGLRSPQHAFPASSKLQHPAPWRPGDVARTRKDARQVRENWLAEQLAS